MIDAAPIVYEPPPSAEAFPPNWKLPGEIGRGVAPNAFPIAVDFIELHPCHSEQKWDFETFVLTCEKGRVTLHRARHYTRTPCELHGHKLKPGAVTQSPVDLQIGESEYTHLAVKGQCIRCGVELNIGTFFESETAEKLGLRIEEYQPWR